MIILLMLFIAFVLTVLPQLTPLVFGFLSGFMLHQIYTRRKK